PVRQLRSSIPPMKRIAFLAAPIIAVATLASCGQDHPDPDEALHDAFTLSRESAYSYWDALADNCMSYYRSTYGNAEHLAEKWERTEEPELTKIEVDSDAGTVAYAKNGEPEMWTEHWVYIGGEWKKDCGTG